MLRKWTRSLWNSLGLAFASNYLHYLLDKSIISEDDTTLIPEEVIERVSTRQLIGGQVIKCNLNQIAYYTADSNATGFWPQDFLNTQSNTVKIISYWKSWQPRNESQCFVGHINQDNFHISLDYPLRVLLNVGGGGASYIFSGDQTAVEDKNLKVVITIGNYRTSPSYVCDITFAIYNSDTDEIIVTHTFTDFAAPTSNIMFHTIFASDTTGLARRVGNGNKCYRYEFYENDVIKHAYNFTERFGDKIKDWVGDKDLTLTTDNMGTTRVPNEGGLLLFDYHPDTTGYYIADGVNDYEEDGTTLIDAGVIVPPDLDNPGKAKAWNSGASVQRDLDYTGEANYVLRPSNCPSFYTDRTSSDGYFKLNNGLRWQANDTVAMRFHVNNFTQRVNTAFLGSSGTANTAFGLTRDVSNIDQFYAKVSGTSAVFGTLDIDLETIGQFILEYEFDTTSGSTSDITGRIYDYQGNVIAEETVSWSVANIDAGLNQLFGTGNPVDDQPISGCHQVEYYIGGTRVNRWIYLNESQKVLWDLIAGNHGVLNTGNLSENQGSQDIFSIEAEYGFKDYAIGIPGGNTIGHRGTIGSTTNDWFADSYITGGNSVKFEFELLNITGDFTYGVLVGSTSDNYRFWINGSKLSLKWDGTFYNHNFATDKTGKYIPYLKVSLLIGNYSAGDVDFTLYAEDEDGNIWVNGTSTVAVTNIAQNICKIFSSYVSSALDNPISEVDFLSLKIYKGGVESHSYDSKEFAGGVLPDSIGGLDLTITKSSGTFSGVFRVPGDLSKNGNDYIGNELSFTPGKYLSSDHEVKLPWFRKIESIKLSDIVTNYDFARLTGSIADRLSIKKPVGANDRGFPAFKFADAGDYLQSGTSLSGVSIVKLYGSNGVIGDFTVDSVNDRISASVGVYFARMDLSNGDVLVYGGSNNEEVNDVGVNDNQYTSSVNSISDCQALQDEYDHFTEFGYSIQNDGSNDYNIPNLLTSETLDLGVGWTVDTEYGRNPDLQTAKRFSS